MLSLTSVPLTWYDSFVKNYQSIMKERHGMIEYVIYKGKKFTIEWYYDDRGKSEVFDYFNKLTLDRQLKLYQLVKLIGDIGSIKNIEKFRHEDDQIYAFKPNPDRFFLFLLQRIKNNCYKCL